MSLKSLIPLFFALAATPAVSQTFVEGVNLGDSTLDFAIYHARVALDKHRQGVLELYWNRADSTHYRKAVVKLPSLMDIDPNHPLVLRTMVYERNGGGDSLIFETKDAIEANEGVSLRLSCRNGGASLFVGSLIFGKTLTVPFDFNKPNSFGTKTSDYLTGTRHSLIYAVHDKPPVLNGLSQDEIRARIETSSDPKETIWQHLDRDFPKQGVRLDHKYILASVADGDGGYYLIDLTPGEKGLALKAHLTPTIFKDNFDMVWYPVKGPKQDDDCYAEFSMDDHLLTIHIPTLKASFRLRRVPKD